MSFFSFLEDCIYYDNQAKTCFCSNLVIGDHQVVIKIIPTERKEKQQKKKYLIDSLHCLNIHISLFSGSRRLIRTPGCGRSGARRSLAGSPTSSSLTSRHTSGSTLGRGLSSVQQTAATQPLPGLKMML